ncbi:hypothetical protein E4U55_005898 [Claviceps digitariae]|nr:hypothetical protein E4U55_005898 [Claviceps digitariae]
MRLTYAIVLAAASTALAGHGPSVHVLISGHGNFGLVDNQEWRDEITLDIWSWCQNKLGGGFLSGSIKKDNSFDYSCDCGHGDTELPKAMNGRLWNGYATRGDKC